MSPINNSIGGHTDSSVCIVQPFIFFVGCSIKESMCAVLSTELLENVERKRKSEFHGICLYKVLQDFYLLTWCYFAFNLSASSETKFINMHGEREHKGDSTFSGCILQTAYIKKEKLFQGFHPLFFLMSNVSILWKSNKLSCYILFLWPLHWINTWFTWLFKDQQKTSPCNMGCGNMFFIKVLQRF